MGLGCVGLTWKISSHEEGHKLLTTDIVKETTTTHVKARHVSMLVQFEQTCEAKGMDIECRASARERMVEWK